MTARWLRSGWSLAVFVPALLLAVVGSVAYLQRDLVLAHWHARTFLRKDGADESLRWIRKHQHRALVLPIAAEALHQKDSAACRRAGVLVRTLLADFSDPTQPDAAQLSFVTMTRLRDSLPYLQPAARREALEAAHHVLRVHLERWSPHVPTVLDSAGAVFLSSLEDEDLLVKEAALRKLTSLWPAIAVDSSAGPLVREWLREAYLVAAHMMSSVEPGVRLAAGAACCHAPFSEYDAQLAMLLDDDDVAVRKGALIALGDCKRNRLHGAQKNLVLRWLADADPNAAAAAAKVLRLAGVPAYRVELVALQASPQPQVRAKAAAAAMAASKKAENAFDPAPFLIALSEDEAADVRLAVVDAAAATTDESLLARFRTMAREDPDPRVRTRCGEVAKK
jgi:hypothetical protein